MLYTLFSWLVIGLSAFLWGFGILFVLSKINHYHSKALDLVIITGLCGLTVYAQIFSLFYKIGIIALFSVFLLDAIWMFIIYKELKNWIKGIKRQFLITRLFLVAVVGIIVLIAASGKIGLYDTSLYHAQAIRWIEEYGVVYGLGNLHTRLAYNSSFLCLQALFSFRYLIGKSLHSMNGFVMWLILSYAVCSMKFWQNRKICASDFTRLALISYYSGIVGAASSPGTDSFAMGLTGYILCKWITLLEDDEKRITPYAYLCVLGVYVISLKVSSIMIVFLIIVPAYWLIAEKKWKEIILYLGLGILTIAPFLIRNVIISGYLLYPYPELDLFSFDWKIPASEAAYERTVIKAWAQGYRGDFPTNAPFTEWFPLWRDNILLADSKMYIEFIADIVAIPISLIFGMVKGLQKKNWHFLHITCCLTIGILFWFFNAPTRRFGEIYLLLLPLYLVGNILEIFKSRIAAAVIATAVLTVIGGDAVKYLVNGAIEMADRSYLVTCADYINFDCQLTNIGGLNIYYPETGSDLTGYSCFPSTPYVNRLSIIELRGESFAEGFRPKSAD